MKTDGPHGTRAETTLKRVDVHSVSLCLYKVAAAAICDCAYVSPYFNVAEASGNATWALRAVQVGLTLSPSS